MRKSSIKTIQTVVLSLSATCFLGNTFAQAQTNNAKPEVMVSPAMNNDVAPSAKPMTEEERAAQANKMKADREQNMKIGQLNKEIQEADKAGKGETPEMVGKKAELKKLQEERNTKMKAEREQMMKDRPMPTPEEMEANKKMGQLNKEIKDAEKEGKGDTPEMLAKKAELKKMQEARVAKMKADRDKKMKAQQVAPQPAKMEVAPVQNEKK